MRIDSTPLRLILMVHSLAIPLISAVDRTDKLEGRARKVRSIDCPDEPDGVGHVTIFVRESCRDNDGSVLQPVRFPFARFDRSRFRFSQAWIRFCRRTPIYADRETRQTIIYTRHAVYLLPSMKNRHGQLFSVAELLAHDYASFSNRRDSRSRHFDIGQYMHGSNADGLGMPRFNGPRGGFVDEIETTYKSNFDVRCVEDDDEDEDDRSSGQYEDEPLEEDEKYRYKSRRRQTKYTIKKKTTTTMPAQTTRAPTTMPPQTTRALTTEAPTSTNGTIVYNQSFTTGQDSPSQCEAWKTFQCQLISRPYSSLTISGSKNERGVTLTYPSIVQGIAQALRIPNAVYKAAILPDGSSWAVVNCNGTKVLTTPAAGCSCTAGGYAVRPCSGNKDWGGVDGATCGAPSQRIIVTFRY